MEGSIEKTQRHAKPELERYDYFALAVDDERRLRPVEEGKGPQGDHNGGDVDHRNAGGGLQPSTG